MQRPKRGDEFPILFPLVPSGNNQEQNGCDNHQRDNHKQAGRSGVPSRRVYREEVIKRSGQNGAQDIDGNGKTDDCTGSEFCKRH